MKKQIHSRILSACLALLMVLSMIPASVFAVEESATVVFSEITAAEQLTDGNYVMVVDTGYAPGSLSGGWVSAVQPTVTEGSISAPADADYIWTLSLGDDSTVKLTDCNGVTVGPKGGNNNGIQAKDYSWSWSFADGKVRFAGVGSDTVFLASNSGTTGTNPGNHRFRGYKTTTVNSYPDSYPCDFTLYKAEGTVTPDPDPEPEEPAYVTIGEAVAGEKGNTYTVKGVVTLLDGKNIYLHDGSKGICLRTSDAPSDIALGDTLIATGSLTVYSGMPQLGSGTYVKSSGMTLTPKKVTIGQLTTEEFGRYVQLTNVEVTEVYDKDGTYSAPNITVTDGTNQIQLYKAVIGKTDGQWDVQVGDKLNILAAVGQYNTTVQLRNTLASEITKAAASDGRTSGVVTDRSTLKDGDQVVIFNPANGKSMSTEYSGFYNVYSDVRLVDGKLQGYTEADVWTLGVNEDGTYTFSTADGKQLSMGEKYSSMPLDDVNKTWTIQTAATEGCFYIQNVARGSYIEWYADKSNWSSYYAIGTNEALFAQQLYYVAQEDISGGETQPGGLPQAGDQVMIFNQNAQAVLAGENDSLSLEKADATVTDGRITQVANGGVIFTVERNGEYFRFYNERYGYLCSNGTGNNAFYSKDFSQEGVTTDDADWLVRECTGGVGGYELESRTAKYNGRYSQWLEYYADSFKTYSMYNVTDYTIYSFSFYPVDSGIRTEYGVANDPKVVITSGASVMKGQDYTLTFRVDDINAVPAENIQVMDINGDHHSFTAVEEGYAASIPADAFWERTSLDFTVRVSYEEVKYDAVVTVQVIDEPAISDVTPAANTQTGEDKRPEISATVTNAGENPTVTMTINEKVVDAVYDQGKITYRPAADLADGRTTVTITVTRQDGKTVQMTWTFLVGKSQYQLYFGQLHSHTGQYSDGAGTLDSALSYIRDLPLSANVHFVAFTDHSNYFDSKSNPNVEAALYDISLVKDSDASHSWSVYKQTIADFNAANAGTIVGLAGFEMTWSGGPGHINTWNTEGIVSRNNTTLNNKTDDAGMKAYYALLSQAEGVDSISQFNHPGSTFGTFSDFSYWDPVIDSRIYLVEVGNGEGQIGAGGYYPSYEQYTVALDKGWHVAPSNNQDNHKGKWGNANDARDVILAECLTEEGLYEAIRALRVYASEDKNLEIHYTVNGNQLGSIITEKPEKLDVNITVYDPDKTDSISKVELIVNSGKVAYTWDDPAVLALGELTAELSPDFSYYYVRVTQADGDLAVTAPVWVGESLKLGISAFQSQTSTPVTGEKLTLATTLFNSESTPATIKSITYTVGDQVLLYKDNADLPEGQKVVAAGSTLDLEMPVTFQSARVYTVKVTVILELDGQDFTFTKELSLDVLNADDLVYIGIDASHYNEYVAGNYADSMGNFSNLAGGYSVRTVDLKTSEDLIAACANSKYKALILTAPSRRLAAAQKELRTYSDEELKAIAAFNAAGGVVILAGWSDHYEYYPEAFGDGLDAQHHMAATQNAVLKALGSSLRISDDATYDDVYSAIDGCDPYRLYFNTYNMDNLLNAGVEYDDEHPYDSLYTEKFSHYGGASIYAVDASGEAAATLPATVSPVVFGHESTYSKDTDADGLGGDIPKYASPKGDDRLLIMATEQLEGKGLIVVSGAAFMSNFEVQASISDNGSEKNYANYRICENLVQHLNPVKITPIGEVNQVKETGYKFTIEGIVTANASGYDKDTAFFDCTYVQDETGGINVFPVAGDYKIGDKVRITGTTAFYQGEIELSVTDIVKLSENNPVEPKEVTAAQVNDGSVTGLLVTIKGTVTHIEYKEGLVESILVKDAEGNTTRVFIDGYITKDKEIRNLEIGCQIQATGLASYDNTYVLSDGTESYPRIRIRDRDDILCTKAEEKPTEPTEPEVPTEPVEPTNPEAPSEKPTEKPEKPDSGNAGTGDSQNPALLIAILAIAAIGFVAILFLMRDKKDKQA